MARFITLTFNDGTPATTLPLPGETKPVISGGSFVVGEKSFALSTLASMEETSRRVTPARDAKVADLADATENLTICKQNFLDGLGLSSDDVNLALFNRLLPDFLIIQGRWDEAHNALTQHDQNVERARLAAKEAKENPKPKPEPKPKAPTKAKAHKK